MTTPTRLLCTFPGKFGDLLWALPTIRAISRRIDAPVDLLIAKAFTSIAPLIEAQPYIDHCDVDLHWETQDTAPISPRLPSFQPNDYDATVHLGYRGWPLPDCARHTLDTANLVANDWRTRGVLSLPWTRLTIAELDLADPWITEIPSVAMRVGWNGDHRIAVGFTDEHFELKFGLMLLVGYADYRRSVVAIGKSPRWGEEGGLGQMSWGESAKTLQTADVFLGCCSALHVLAVAMGIPVVLMEPAEARWNPVFYPLGQSGPQVTLVRGTTAQPTCDARHVGETLDRVLASRKEPIA